MSNFLIYVLFFMFLVLIFETGRFIGAIESSKQFEVLLHD